MALRLRERVAEFLEQNPNRRFTAREIAEWIFENYPEACEEKRRNSTLTLDTDAKLIQELVSNISTQRPQLQKIHPEIRTTEDRPKQYYYSTASDEEEISDAEGNALADQPAAAATSEAGLQQQEQPRREHDLYPLLSEYLYAELNVDSKRIDESRSRNTRGKHGNKWLHPDLVGLEPLNIGWEGVVNDFSQQHGGQRIRLWSFEVKLRLNNANLRESFFQTVSNSSWANLGYLVAADIDERVMPEIRLLSARHGIGLIKLNPENPAESQLLLPAEEKPSLDWGVINSLVEQNPDFKAYIMQCKEYYLIKAIKPNEWDYDDPSQND